MTKSPGFIDFTDLDDHDPDAWRGQVEKEGKVFIPQGQRCHETHPDLSLGGGTLLGGNCRDHKRHKNVDLYVALDYGMAHPEFEIGSAPARCVYYPIQNMKYPSRPDKFHALIDLIIAVLAKGGRVHVGCIGGHGRTGLVIAAVVAKLKVDDDAIGWTRQHYCDRAIETEGQENFLIVNFGSKVQPAILRHKKYGGKGGKRKG